MKRSFVCLSLALVGAGASAQSATTKEVAARHPDVLLILADDLGVGELATFGLGSDYAVTPNLDALAADGMSFTHVYATPICSPTRAAVLTGRHGFRTGVGDFIKVPDLTGTTYGLPLAEETIPEMLTRGSAGAYAHAVFGKWHLGSDSSGGVLAPNLAGFAYADHRPGNLTGGEDYFSWTSVIQGLPTPLTGYTATYTVDEALAWIGRQTRPWFAYVPLNLAHSPFHEPPAGHFSEDLSSVPVGPNRPHFKAMIEAMDFELGRLLSGLGAALDDTTVIFLGDNGSPGDVIAPPWPSLKAKDTVYEGGVRVPLIVRSPLVASPGSTSDALVNSTDLFATIAEIAGIDIDVIYGPGVQHDSVSLVPYLLDPELPSLRSFVYTERFSPNGLAPTAYLRVIRNERYKLWVTLDPAPGERFYDLDLDPFEETDLLTVGLSPDETAAYLSLKQEMMTLLGPAF